VPVELPARRAPAALEAVDQGREHGDVLGFLLSVKRLVDLARRARHRGPAGARGDRDAVVLPVAMKPAPARGDIWIGGGLARRRVRRDHGHVGVDVRRHRASARPWMALTVPMLHDDLAINKLASRSPM